MRLAGTTSYYCTSSTFNSPVTYITPHWFQRDDDQSCTNLPRGLSVAPQAQQWWVYDEPDPDWGFLSGDPVYVPRDDDGDGIDEVTDCDDHFYDPSNACDYESYCGVSDEDVRACNTQSDYHWYDFYEWGPEPSRCATVSAEPLQL